MPALSLTVATHEDAVIPLEVDTETTLGTLKAQLEGVTNVRAANQQLLLNAAPLQGDEKTLGSLGLSNGDLVMLLPAGGLAAPAAAGTAPAANPMALNAADGTAVNPSAFLANLRRDTATMGQLRMQNPSLARAIENNDVEALQSYLRQAHAAREDERRRERELDELAMADPMDPEAQRKIYEKMQQKNIEENMSMAMEHTPEAFGSVIMLYVKMSVNGHPLTAFVDSGAQMTIMNEATAERTGLARLIDKRWSGMAKGVGTSKIVGRIHQAPLVVKGSDGKDKHLSCTITVLESQDMEFLFGLDMLKRFQCSIDLMHNQLRFGSVDASLPFLAEHELPAHIREKGPPDSPTKAAGGGAATSSAPPPSASGAADEKVKALMALGFPRDACERALQSAGGNQDLAASLLFEGGAM